MTDQLRWRAKRGAPSCWETPCGYTVALCRLPNNRYTVTAPGGSAPFAYTDRSEDIPGLIQAHKEAQVVCHG